MKKGISLLFLMILIISSIYAVKTNSSVNEGENTIAAQDVTPLPDIPLHTPTLKPTMTSVLTATSTPTAVYVFLKLNESDPPSVLYGSSVYTPINGYPEANSSYRWLVDDEVVADGMMCQPFYLSLDNTLISSTGDQPMELSGGFTFLPGYYGSALQYFSAKKSFLGYPAAGNIDLNEGSVAMWVKLTYEFSDPVYESHPMIFNYPVNQEHQIFIDFELNSLIFSNYQEGKYYQPEVEPPGWHAGEWHHITATWSASENRQALYYDCVLAGEYEYPALQGKAEEFFVGSGNGWGYSDVTLDDVVIHQWSLKPEEIAAACESGKPASPGEVPWSIPDNFMGGSVAFEVIHCNTQGECRPPAQASMTIPTPTP